MEIERNVAVEIVREESDPKGNLRAPFSSGPRGSGSLPTYSDSELEKLELGDQIRNLFANTNGEGCDQAQALSSRNVSGKPFGSPLPQKRFGS